LVTALVDAYTEDGKRVVIKEVGRNDEEVRIARMLTSGSVEHDPRNHCVPILQVIDDPDGLKSLLVMPLLRPMDNPPFDHVKEIVDFVDQLLEGLVFLHENGVAHRDCVRANLMMDADAMYPEGFHPILTTYKPDYSGEAPYIPRSAAGVKYYFVDFGISVHIPASVYPKLVTGHLGRDQTPPELSTTIPYDPFKLDIYILGNMFKCELLDKYTNLEFLSPLVGIMTQPPPRHRPTAQEALYRWRKMKGAVGTIHGEWRPRAVDEDACQRFVLDIVSLYSVFMHFAKAFVTSVSG